MPSARWKSQLESSQSGYLQLILNGLLGVQILSVLRDLTVIGFNLPVQLVAINVVITAVMLALVVWLWLIGFSAQHTNKVVLFVLTCTGIKAIAAIAAQADPLPFYMAVLMFSLSLCFLSQQYMLFTAGIITAIWVNVALYTLNLVEVVETFVSMIVGLTLGIFVQRRRIASLVEVFELQGRVESLESILPMCASCKKTRNSQGDWKSIETYIEEHQSGLHVSHGLCPDCLKEQIADF